MVDAPSLCVKARILPRDQQAFPQAQNFSIHFLGKPGSDRIYFVISSGRRSNFHLRRYPWSLYKSSTLMHQQEQLRSIKQIQGQFSWRIGGTVRTFVLLSEMWYVCQLVVDMQFLENGGFLVRISQICKTIHLLRGYLATACVTKNRAPFTRSQTVNGYDAALHRTFTGLYFHDALIQDKSSSQHGRILKTG